MISLFDSIKYKQNKISIMTCNLHNPKLYSMIINNKYLLQVYCLNTDKKIKKLSFKQYFKQRPKSWLDAAAAKL